MIDKKNNRIKSLLHHIFDEAIELIESMSLKKGLFSILAFILLGTSVTLLLNTSMGMSAWDAVSVNIYENTNLYFMWVNPLISLFLMGLAHLIMWKKPSIMFFFPIIISWFIGAVIDLEVLFVPDMSSFNLIWNITYMVIASILVGIGLNILLYLDFPLPAIDRFCHSLASRLHLTFGQGKFLGEFFAMSLAIILGLIYHTEADNFYLGVTTIYYVLFLGGIVDLIRNPLYRILGIPTVEIYRDDLLPQDRSENKIINACAIIISNNKLLVVYDEELNYYFLPHVSKAKMRRMEVSLKREVKDISNIQVKVNEEHLIIKEYKAKKTYINHYFIVKFKKQNNTNSKRYKSIWIDPLDALNIFNEYDSNNQLGMEIMNREFIALTTIF